MMTDENKNGILAFFTNHLFYKLMILFIIGRMIASFLVPIFDPSEGRYSSMSQNMARTGNFLEPQFYHDGTFQVFEGKPPLFFQSAGVCCKIFGINEFAVRFPALISALAILAFIYFTVRELRNERSAVFATLLCACTPVFFVFAGLCMTDLMLAAAASGAVMSYMLFTAAKTEKKRKLGSVLFFACLGVGMIVKGPVALVMAGLPIFLYVLINNRWKDLKNHAWIAGPIVFLLISLPWYVIMTMKNPGFPEYFFINENFKRFLFHEYGDKYGNGRESFRGMAAIFFLVVNLPFILYIPLTAWKRCVRKEFYTRELFRDALTGMPLLLILSNTLFWCLTSRVLITYLLPTIPAAAIFVQEMLVRNENNFGGWLKKSVKIAVPLLLILTVISLIGTAFIGQHLTSKIAGNAFRKVQELPEFQQYQCYFLNGAPYSAEFYLNDSIYQHKKEPDKNSMAKSGDYLLLMISQDAKAYRDIMASQNRKELLHYGMWHVFSPIPKTESDSNKK